MNDAIVELGVSRDGVATLMMNRPEVHNAFDEALIARLTDTLRQLDEDPAVRVVVLGGHGRSFSAGADLNWMKRMSRYSEAENLHDARHLAGLMRTLDRMRKPTIARVHGSAFGGGVGLVACCDMAVVSEAALFCLSEVRLGLIPAVISPYVIQAMGARAARRYFLTAERFDAREALRLGLATAVTSSEDLDRTVTSLVGELLKGGPQAQAAAKDLIQAVADRPIDSAVGEDTAARIARTRASAEGREGIGAFLDKRAPAWVAGGS